MALAVSAAPEHAGDSVWRRDRALQYAHWRAAQTTVGSHEVWDSPEAPRLTVVPAGEYLMGSAEAEVNHAADEAPRHRVRIAYELAVSTYPVTVGEFARFVAATDYRSGNQCEKYEREEGERPAVRNWRRPGFDQDDTHPVTCVSWADAEAYIAWLSKRTGQRYRLLSEAEFEYVARGGTRTAYWWGEDAGRGHANCDGCGSPWGDRSTAPVGSFPPNAFGLYDTAGNAWSWTGDCWNASYATAPTDGTASTTGDCNVRVLRGGSWYFTSKAVRAASRYWVSSRFRFYDVGFRVARAP